MIVELLELLFTETILYYNYWNYFNNLDVYTHTTTPEESNRLQIRHTNDKTTGSTKEQH